MRVRYTRCGALCGLLMLSAILLTTIEDSQRLVFAQITPAPEKAGSSDESSSASSPDTDNGNGVNNNGPSNDDEDRDDKSDASESDGDEHSTTEKQDDEMTTSEEETNPLLDAIKNKVSKELSAAGITDLGF